MTVGPPPSDPVLPIDTVGELLTNALVDGGIVGIDESIEQPILNRALKQYNWLISQWSRKRWLNYRIQDYAITSTGAQSYTVGLGQTVNINPRPDRLEYAFVRFLNLNTAGPPQFPVDIPIDIIQSHEDYSRITVKTIGTLPWRVFYDPKWPIGELLFWPVPQQSIYEMHVGFKAVLVRASSLQSAINYPPEYEAAFNWCLATRFRVSYQLPPDPEVNSLARDALNTIREANAAMGTLRLPAFLRNRQRAYDYRGDSDSF